MALQGHTAVTLELVGHWQGVVGKDLWHDPTGYRNRRRWKSSSPSKAPAPAAAESPPLRTAVAAVFPLGGRSPEVAVRSGPGP